MEFIFFVWIIPMSHFDFRTIFFLWRFQHPILNYGRYISIKYVQITQYRLHEHVMFTAYTHNIVMGIENKHMLQCIIITNVCNNIYKITTHDIIICEWLCIIYHFHQIYGWFVTISETKHKSTPPLIFVLHKGTENIFSIQRYH
jgi:hypothetical protein